MSEWSLHKKRRIPRAFNKPLRLRLFPSLSEELEELEEDDLVVGTPVDEESRVTERVNAASRS
jgi:hypothetical protein